VQPVVAAGLNEDGIVMDESGAGGGDHGRGEGLASAAAAAASVEG